MLYILYHGEGFINVEITWAQSTCY